MMSILVLLIKEFNIYLIKSSDFFNVNSSFNISNRLLIFSVNMFDMMMHGIVSQISYLGSSLCFM